MPKILFTSDLHLCGESIDFVSSIIKNKIRESNPDIFVISGDVSDIPSHNTFGFLSEFDLPVVFCLGNHEFFYSSVEKTLQKYRNDYADAVSHGVKNAHCLDIDGHFDTHGIRFCGNVLWYDGSLSNRFDTTKIMERIDESWMDSTIMNFHAKDECMKCIGQIQSSMEGAGSMKTVLVTHTVPHRKLNLFDHDNPLSLYNAYSGVENLFDSCHIYPDIALCGHTHRRVLYEHKAMNGKGILCCNSGNNYFFEDKAVIFDEIEL